MRAFNYFYLVNLYGNVPLSLSTDYKINSLLARADTSTVYNQIVADLTDAIDLLGDSYVTASGTPTTERVRPNKSTAKALLARVHLFRKDYLNADIQATSIIENNSLYDTVTLNSVFLKNSKEAIWQLQPVGMGTNANTKEGQFFIPREGSTVNAPALLSSELLSAFELGDNRKIEWINSTVDINSYYYPFKYKVGSVEEADLEYSMVFRLAEQFLIRAEARAFLGDFDGATKDLNIIRKRAGLPDLPQIISSDIIQTVLHERQVELFTEWGHRWLDLKRLQTANAVLSVVKGANWQETDELYPIPQQEIDKNPSLAGQQNPGYN